MGTGAARVQLRRLLQRPEGAARLVGLEQRIAEREQRRHRLAVDLHRLAQFLRGGAIVPAFEQRLALLQGARIFVGRRDRVRGRGALCGRARGGGFGGSLRFHGRRRRRGFRRRSCLRNARRGGRGTAGRAPGPDRKRDREAADAGDGRERNPAPPRAMRRGRQDLPQRRGSGLFPRRSARGRLCAQWRDRRGLGWNRRRDVLGQRRDPSAFVGGRPDAPSLLRPGNDTRDHRIGREALRRLSDRVGSASHVVGHGIGSVRRGRHLHDAGQTHRTSGGDGDLGEIVLPAEPLAPRADDGHIAHDVDFGQRRTLRLGRDLLELFLDRVGDLR